MDFEDYDKFETNPTEENLIEMKPVKIKDKKKQ